MELVLDADALIKLNRCGLLLRILDSFLCAVPQEVYDEVIVDGERHGYRDVPVIKNALASSARVMTGPLAESQLGLGSGEQGILRILPQLFEPTVVSDDRRFLSVLAVQAVPSIITVDLIVLMVLRTNLSVDEAREALGILRPFVRDKDYESALEEISSRGSST